MAAGGRRGGRARNDNRTLSYVRAMAVIHQATISPTKQEILDSELCSAVTILGSYRFDDPAGEVGVEGFIVETSRGRSHLVLTYRGAPLGGARSSAQWITPRWASGGCTTERRILLPSTACAVRLPARRLRQRSRSGRWGQGRRARTDASVGGSQQSYGATRGHGDPGPAGARPRASRRSVCARRDLGQRVCRHRNRRTRLTHRNDRRPAFTSQVSAACFAVANDWDLVPGSERADERGGMG